MSLKIEQHRCRICLEYSTETISAHDQVAAGISYLDITLKFTNELKLDGSSDELLHICMPCANMAKTAYNIKEPSEEADYKLEFEEEITTEEKVKTEKIEDEKVTSNGSNLSLKEEMHNVSKTEQTLEASLEHVTIEEALEVYYDKPCNKTLNYRRKLRSHSRVVDKLDKLQCDYCEYTPESLNDYTKHVDAEHADKRAKNCNYCDEVFFDTRALKDHLRSHSNIKTYECEGCGSKFAWRSSLSKHLKTHKHCSMICDKNKILKSHTASKTYENKVDKAAWFPFACKICDKKFSRTANLRRHSKVVHNSDDKSCYFCAFLPKSPDDLSKHITQEHADKKPWACKECGNTYFQQNNLKRHLLTHKGTKGKHVCNVCDYEAQFKCEMDMHVRKHTGEKPFSCLKCGRKFSTSRNLKNHVKTHEWGDSDTSDNETENDSKSVAQKTLDSYVCKMCSKEFAHHSSLRKHSEGMHYIQISCNYCEYIPTCSSDLERHIKKAHSDKKYFACDQCDEAFFSARNLKTHVFLECDTKTYECKICNSKCTTKSNLMRHLRMHTGEKPFLCSDCGKAFKQYQNLKVHIANQSCKISNYKVHKADPKNEKRAYVKQPDALKIYACKFCDKTCRFRTDIRNHTRKVHKINDTSCFFCDYVPTSNYDLHMHSEKEHADKKTISCEHCDKTFFDVINLKSHLAVHNTVGIHVCKICGHKYTTKSYLMEHMTIHSTIKSKLQRSLKSHTFTK